MTALVLEPTITAQWLGLVKAAESWNQHDLPEDLESYLVFLLIRFMKKPELAASVLAMDYLRAFEGSRRQAAQLQEVGDKCLLLAGLFPERAERKRVQVSYFVEMGQSAYSAIADISKIGLAEFYQSLCRSFITLMDILHAARGLAGNQLTPLQAADLWNEARSPHALNVLQGYSKGSFINCSSANIKKLH